MSKLDELIAKFCPDGVEYRELNEIAHYAKKRIDATEINENTYVGVENLLQNKRGKTIPSSVPNSGKVIQFQKGDILIGNIRPYLKKIWLSDCMGGTNGDVLAIQINDRTQITPEFLYYVMSSEKFFLYDVQNSKGAKMPRGDKEAVMKYKLPVPPLEVQHEIVHFLDSFTLLIVELIAELTARKKQYEFYRDKLLTGSQEIPSKKISEFAELRAGATPSTLKKEYWEQGTIPWMSSGEVNQGKVSHTEKYITEKGYKNSSTKMLPINTVVIALAGQGKTRGTVAITKIPLCTNQSLCGICTDESVDSTYLYYYLKSRYQNLRDISNGDGTRGGLNLKMIGEYKVPVPSLEIQKRIVNVLDNFESICTDLNIGLPAEIEARQKQYEYYRDLLLTFAETDRQS